jgi:hypothetical protein
VAGLGPRASLLDRQWGDHLSWPTCRTACACACVGGF